MFTLYLVQGFLFLEGVTLTLLLMPYLSRYTAPIVEGILSTLRLPFKVIFGILVYFTFDSFAEMRKLQLKLPLPAQTPSTEDVSAYRARFEMERNFYIIIIRLDSIMMIFRSNKRALEEYENRELDRLRAASAEKTKQQFAERQRAKEAANAEAENRSTTYEHAA